MTKIEFITKSKLSRSKFFKYFLDFESYSQYFPGQIKNIEVIEKNGNEIITEEKIVFSTIIKNTIQQKTKHQKISDNELMSEILEGPAKGSTINVKTTENEEELDIEFLVDLKLSLKAKFLEPLIKKFYKKYLTALVQKFYTREIREAL